MFVVIFLYLASKPKKGHTDGKTIIDDFYTWPLSNATATALDAKMFHLRQVEYGAATGSERFMKCDETVQHPSQQRQTDRRTDGRTDGRTALSIT